MPFLFASLVVLHSALMWIVNVWFHDHGRDFMLVTLLVTQGILALFYLKLRTLHKAPFGWWIGALLLAFGSLTTPSLLQTDQLRYLWDGLQSAQGFNPYRSAPAEALATAQSNLPWTHLINHPDLHTVYPPLAQGLFQVTTYLNPFLWSSFSTFRGLTWPQSLPISLFWPWELGWRMIVGACTALIIFLNRTKRWDLLVFHPLFFLVVLTNVHVDIVLVATLALFFSATANGFGGRPVLLALAILSRWSPLLFVPLAFAKWSRNAGSQSALSKLIQCAIFCYFGVCLYWFGAQGNFFSSAKVYGAHWLFFGYLHRFLSDVLSVFVTDPIKTAKIILSLLFFGTMVRITQLVWRGSLSLRLACTISYLVFLMVSPTLHPWYLLPLLFLGLPFQKQLPSLWIWPLVAPASYFFYFNMQDPLWIRYSVYLFLTPIVSKDLIKCLA